MQTKIFFLLIVFLGFITFSKAESKRIESIKNESTITYKLKHPLHEVEAISKSSQCVVEIDNAKKEINAVAVQVAVTSFNSGNSNRDSHAMEVIDALSYPEATFISNNIIQNGDSLKITGELTFHGITKDVTINAISKWLSNKFEVDGNFNISLTEFHIDRPSLLLIPVEDTLRFSFKQYFNL